MLLSANGPLLPLRKVLLKLNLFYTIKRLVHGCSSQYKCHTKNFEHFEESCLVVNYFRQICVTP